MYIPYNFEINHTSPTTNNHRFLLKNSIPLAPQLIVVARIFNTGAINGLSFFLTLYSALANFPTPFAVFFTTFLPAITTVLIIPAIDIAIAENPIKFCLAHSLNFSSLVKSLV